MTDTSPFEPSLVGAIWRDRVLVVCALVASLSLAVAYAVTRPVQYSATASVLVEDPRDQTGDPPERFVADQAAVIRSSNVAREAARLDLARRPPLGLSMTYYLKHTAVSLSARDSNLIRVSLSASGPTAAKLGVDNVVNAYKNVLHTNATTKYKSQLDQIDAELVRIDGSLTNVSRQIAATPVPTGAVLDGLEVQQRQLLERQNNLRVDRESVVGQVDQATRTVALYDPPEKATKAGLLASARTLVLAIMLGFILAGTAAYIRATRRPTFFRANEPELVLGAPLLADVPGFDGRRGRALPVIEAPSSAAARAYRYAAASIDLQRASAGVRCLAVTSAGEGDGRSTATANIALGLAGSGVHTLVIDGDLETQGLSGLLRGNQVARPGWLDLVAGRAGLTDVIVRVPTGSDEGLALDLLTAGERHTSAAEFFGGENSRRLIEVLLAELADRYDVVLIDAPPMLQVTHAATLAGCAESVLVVVSHGGSLADQEEIGRRLRLIGRAPLGYVYNHPAGRRGARRDPAPAASQSAASQSAASQSAALRSGAHPAASRPAEPAIAVVPAAAPTAKVPNLRPATTPLAESWTCACSRSNPPAFANCPRCGRSQPGAPRHRTAGG